MSQAKGWTDNDTMTIYRKHSVYKHGTGTRKLEKSTKAFPKLIDSNCITPFFSRRTKYKRQHFHNDCKTKVSLWRAEESSRSELILKMPFKERTHGTRQLFVEARSEPWFLKDRIQVCSVSGELAEGGAPHHLADCRGRGDGVMLDDLLLGASGDRARGRAALWT